MSIYTRGEPVANQQFRDNTERAGKMLCVTRTPKLARCKCCGKLRTALSGKFSKSGRFTCGMCRRQMTAVRKAVQ